MELPMKNVIRNTVEGEVVSVYLTSDEVSEVSSHGVEWIGGEVPAPVTNSSYPVATSDHHLRARHTG
jgi:hypothetical protein